MYDGPVLLQSLLAVGIKGYLLKSVTRHELVAAIRGARADDGRILLSVSPTSLAAQARATSVLSDRERAILELVASAMSNTQIANRLYLTEATVKRHIRNIFVKLEAVSRIDAVNKAIAASMIDTAKPANNGSADGRKGSSNAGV
jgi:DNA-binding NarL/FixJ family response regulator